MKDYAGLFLGFIGGAFIMACIAGLIMTFYSCEYEPRCTSNVEVEYFDGTIGIVVVNGNNLHMHKNGCLFDDQHLYCNVKTAKILNTTCK